MKFSNQADATFRRDVERNSVQVAASINDCILRLDNQGVINVKDYGAKGDGVTDDTAAIQAAIDSAGEGGSIFVPQGNYLLSDTITLLQHQTMYGVGYYLGTGGAPQTQLKWPSLTGSTPGVITGVNCTFQHLLFRGPGKTASTSSGIRSTSGHPRFDHVQFYAWYVGVSLTDAYYSQFESCEWYANAYGVQLTGCYNVDIIAPTFRCYFSSGGVAVYCLSACRNLKITGGSVEGYGASGGVVLYAGSQLTAVGTYWESSIAGTSGFGVEASSMTKVSVNLLGNIVYLTEMNRWLNMSGSTSSSLYSAGNKFVCPVTSGTTPVAYYPPTGNVVIHADDWSNVDKGTYTTALNTGTIAGYYITAPASIGTFLSDYQFIGGSLALYKRTAAPNALNGTLHLADNNLWDPMQQAGSEPYLTFRDTSGYRMVGQHKMAAAPTTGTWRRGDVIWNSTPSLGTDMGWVCTAAGTPGTWTPFGVAGSFVSAGNYADDTAAASGGVAVGQVYRNGSVLQIRVS